MPYEKLQWRTQIREVEHEYLNVRFGLDWMALATGAEVAAFILAHGLVEPPLGAFHDASVHLAATYLIRMYSVFERCVESYWLSWNAGAEPPLGYIVLDDVTGFLVIPYDAALAADRTRRLRNRLVHDNFYDAASVIDLAVDMSAILDYLDRLPSRWD
jgi:hypothetical protein